MRTEEDVVKEISDRNTAHYKWTLDSITRFKLFFAGLVFALLAFSVQFAITTNNHWIIATQIAAWLCLVACGFYALRDAGGFVKWYAEGTLNGLPPEQRQRMWVLFTMGIMLLGIARVSYLW